MSFTPPDFSQFTREQLAQQLVEANGLLQSLNADLAAARAETEAAKGDLAKARMELAQTVAERNEALAKVGTLDALASVKALEIVAAQGATPPLRMPTPGGSMDAEALREQFSRMKPGSPEANEFFKAHRKTLMGR